MTTLWLLLVAGLGVAAADTVPPAIGDTAVGTAPGDSVVLPWRLVTDGTVAVSGQVVPRRTARRLTVGDRFEVEYTVRHPRTLKVSPLLAIDMGDFVVTRRRHVTRYRGDTILDVYRLELAGFATGDVKIPPLMVTWPDGGTVWAAQSDTLQVEIASVLPENMQDINELKPQASMPNLLPLVVVAAVLTLTGLIWLGVRLLRRRRSTGGAVSEAPAWEEALNALQALPVDELLNRGMIKRLYYTVSEIIKRYLTRRFGFAAVEQTTTEIVRELKLVKATARDQFAELFYSVDMVKYSKYVPPDPRLAVERAVALVKGTIPEQAKDEGVGAPDRGKG